MDATEQSDAFADAILAKYKVVVFLSTTGDVLDEAQQAAFERYIHAGGGFVGVHSATDTEYDWPFYGALIGAYFAGHPDIQTATVQVESMGDPSTSALRDPGCAGMSGIRFRENPQGTRRRAGDA